MSKSKIKLGEQVYEIDLTDLANGDFLIYDEDDGKFIPYPSSFLAQANHNHDYIPESGWETAGVWTRTGNHTFTTAGVASDVTTGPYRKGTKVKYQDGGGTDEYGVIGSASHSSGTLTINLIPNTDYAMAAATISGNYLSHIENPEGFPHWFNWNADPQGFSSVPTSVVYKWMAVGTMITLQYTEGTNGTSNATTFTATAPVAPINSVSIPLGAMVDNGTLQTTPGRAVIGAASTTITLRKDMGNGAWTNSNGKRAIVTIPYEF